MNNTKDRIDECFEEVNGEYKLNITDDKLKELVANAREWLLIAHGEVDFETVRMAYRAHYAPHTFKSPSLYSYNSARIISKFISGF